MGKEEAEVVVMAAIPDLMFPGWDEWREGPRLPARWDKGVPMSISGEVMEIVEVPSDEVGGFIFEPKEGRA
jgi:hypothetical protein